MSTADVGDAVELIFTTATGADVTVTWLDPDGGTVVDAAEVTENPAGSGSYPVTFLLTAPGVWTARFAASGTATAVETYYLRASPVTGPLPLAVLGDVGSQLGTLTPAQESITNWLLRAASKLVRARYPNIDAQIAAGLLDPDVVALGVSHMVLRVLRNPGGLRSETVGPFSRTYDTTHAAGLLVITDGEAGMFTPFEEPTVYPVGTIRTSLALAPPKETGCVWRW